MPAQRSWLSTEWMGYLRLNPNNGDEYALDSPIADESSTHHSPIFTRTRKKLLIALAVIFLFVSLFAFRLTGSLSQLPPLTEIETEPELELELEPEQGSNTSPWPPPYAHPFEKEYTIPHECNNLQPIYRADINETIPRHFALKGPKDRVLTIFLWRQQTFGHANIPWRDYARDLCPYPPELGSFFIMYWWRHVQDGEAKWPEGWAPCWMWRINSESDGTVRTCQESGIKFRLTTNYTEFRQADVVYMDYVFYEAEQRSPFWNQALLPPKVGGQVWWLNYGRESVQYYPFVTMTSFLQQFDFTVGAPASLFDLSRPLEPISSSLLQTIVSAPQPPLREDGVLIAWMVSNCAPLNQRKDVMQSLMDEMEVHSFGKCMNNMEIPLDVKQKFGMPEEGVSDQWWGSWQDIKRDIFSKYPFVFTPENSNCEGYVTEKVYDALAAGSIPIYLGAHDIEYYVPPHSIINVQDFENVKALVEYLKEVVNSTDVRMEYYKWKEMVTNDSKTFCSQCLEDSRGIECSILDYATWL